MTPPDDALLPCPHCGTAAYCAMPEPNAYWRVICTADCGAGNYLSSREKAIAAWNRRAGQSASDARVCELECEMKELIALIAVVAPEYEHCTVVANARAALLESDTP